MKALSRFLTTHYNEELRIHFAVHLFLMVTLVAGIWFAFFGWTDIVQASLLWQATNVNLASGVMNVWGYAALAVTALNTYAIGWAKRRLHNAAAMGGFLLWLYAAVLYVTGGYFFHLTVVGIPNMLFWAYYYVATKERTNI
jgi:hypothetical protein